MKTDLTDSRRKGSESILVVKNPSMKVKIDRTLLTEYVGIKSGDPEYDALYEDMRRELLAYAERQPILDSRPTVDLKQLVRLKKAWQRTDKSARFLLGGLVTGPGGWPRPTIDLDAFEANLDTAITTIHWITHGQSRKGRSTESARDWTAQMIANVFKRNYRLKEKDYRQNLDAFLRRLFHSNSLSYPDLHDDYKQRDQFLRSRGLI